MQHLHWILLLLFLTSIATCIDPNPQDTILDQSLESDPVLSAAASPDDIEEPDNNQTPQPTTRTTHTKPKLSKDQKASIRRTLSGWRADPRIHEYRLKTKEMFYHGFSSYMDLAYPKDELMPISGSWVMGDKQLFKTLLPLIKEIDFNINVNVSVFETNIRVVGGLLSCHLMASLDPEIRNDYDYSLLDKAEEMGKKAGESLDVCTACAGTFSLEFTWLSLLTEDPIYEQTARRAVRALWKYRSPIDLFGNHINVATGAWVYKECTIGGLVDSFYEYLLKSSIAFSDEIEYNELFAKAYRAVKIWMKKGDWHVDVLMDSGQITHPYFYSLGAFWPGLKILAGDVQEGVSELNAISEIFRITKFLPEALALQEPVKVVDGRGAYPLRPEFVESLWVAYRATRNPTLLETAYEVVDRLDNYTRTKHGFANVQDVNSMALEDKMESFFLAETLKYLYLLFDPDNEYNTGNYVFNTEAHPFPVWSYHYTLTHPIEPIHELNYLDEPNALAPTSIEHSYKGDTMDPVFSGFKHGVCWKDDWERGVGLNVERWRGKMFHEIPAAQDEKVDDTDENKKKATQRKRK
ncbi:glycoside hydrolase, partial [Obelidium mucronatum]